MYNSALTSILSLGVPEPPLLRNRGPVRALGDKLKLHVPRGTNNLNPHSKMICYMKYLPDPIMADGVFMIR